MPRGAQPRTDFSELPILGGFRENEMSEFWGEKEPCWKIMDCPEYVHKKCPAYLYPESPCWEVAYTRCEVLTSLTKDCTHCKVYRLHHESADH